MTVTKHAIDAADAAILYYLLKHPGASLRRIAAGIGLSLTPVRRRVKLLADRGLIEYGGGNGKTRVRDNVTVHCERVYEVYQV